MIGRIVRIISNLYSVDVDGKIYECRARGKFRFDELTPLVGDIVTISDDNYILEIKMRKNELKRPPIANIDACIIVSSLKRPDFSSYLLDKMLTNIILKDIEPIVVFSKYDLLESHERIEIDSLINYYNEIGIKTLINDDLEKLKSLIKGKTVTLTGQTGVGKSTLLNKLDPNLNLHTQEISDALGRGKHTTRHSEIYKLFDAYLIDTPGFSALDLDVDYENIRFSFPEFRNDECKFSDCKHINEIGCKIKEDLSDGKILPSRYESYKKMVEEYENIRINYKN